MKRKTTKEKFMELLEKRGFKNIHRFSKACGMESSNLYTNLREDFKISIDRAFIYANALGVPIQDVLEVFRGDDMDKNRKAIKKFKTPVD